MKELVAVSAPAASKVETAFALASAIASSSVAPEPLMVKVSLPPIMAVSAPVR